MKSRFIFPRAPGSTRTGLPGFGEVRVPLELVTGYTEVTTLAEKRPVFVGWVFQCPPCTLAPQLVTQPSKGYQTVTHADAISSAGFAGDNRFQLYSIVEQCASAFVKGSGPAANAAAQALAEDLMSVGACKEDGTFLGESNILQAGGPGQAPKAQPGSCGS